MTCQRSMQELTKGLGDWTEHLCDLCSQCGKSFMAHRDDEQSTSGCCDCFSFVVLTHCVTDEESVDDCRSGATEIQIGDQRMDLTRLGEAGDTDSFGERTHPSC